jgi:peptidylprolyl isomerase
MAQAKAGDTVKVRYTGRLESGEVFDSSEGRDALKFTVGGKEIIPGFEQAVEGMNEGESKTVKIACDEAYGQRNEDLMLHVEKKQLPENYEPKVGQNLQIRAPSGETLRVKIAEIGETDVVLDGNHPLAGMDLVFDIKLVEINDAE